MIAGAKLEAGPWLKQFTVLGVITCEVDGCEDWIHVLPRDSNALDVWHATQQHVLEKHLGGPSATVVPPDYYDQLAADDGEPAEPNERTRRGAARLGGVVEQRTEPGEG